MELIFARALWHTNTNPGAGKKTPRERSQTMRAHIIIDDGMEGKNRARARTSMTQ